VKTVQENFSVTEPSWGLVVTRVLESNFSGKGVNVAFLHSGLDKDHPDLSRRRIRIQQFLANEGTGVGVGQFGAGVALANKTPSKGLRYSIAYRSNIFSARVASDSGSVNVRVLPGAIDWAVENNCRIISIPLPQLEQYDGISTLFSILLAKAENGNALILAPGFEGLNTDHPNLLTIGAINQSLEPYRAPFEGRHSAHLFAPGHTIRGPWSGSEGSEEKNGLVPALAYATGIAALYQEAFPVSNGTDLKRRMLETAIPLPFRNGVKPAPLIQAP